MSRKLLLVVGLGLLTAGCVPTPPYKDPLAALTVRRPDSRYAQYTLAVVISDNTQQALKHMADAGSLGRAFGLGLGLNDKLIADVDPRGLTERLSRTLSTRFKSVDVVVSPAEPRSSDLTMIFDARVSLGKMSGSQTTVDLSGIFLDPARAVIDTVEGKGAATVPWPASTFNVGSALEGAFDDFTKHLDAAAKLVAYLSSRPAGGGVTASGPLTSTAARPIAHPISPAELKSKVSNLRGRTWALVVGINAYRHTERLNYAVNDARAVAAALPGLGFQHVRVLLDEDATKVGIERAIYRDLRQSMGPDDRLFVFFAGHGITVRLPRGGEEGYLIPVDGDPSQPELTAIPMDEIRKMGRRVPAKHIFFAIDSCFSGFAATRDIKPEPATDPEIATALDEPVVQVMTAGRKGQKAIEEEGHGLFTRRLLDGLRGLADREGRGFVTVTQLAGWLGPRVARDSGGRQHPQFSALDGEGDFVFVLPERRN